MTGGHGALKKRLAGRSSGKRASGTRRLNVAENLRGYLFIAPATLVIALFGLFPIGYALYVSLYSWRIQQGAFIGLANYQQALGNWGGVLAFLCGVGLLVASYRLWNGAFRASGRESWVKLGAALLLVASGLSLALGWGWMAAAGDAGFLTSLVITLYYAVGAVPVQIGLGLFIASLLFQKIRGRSLFRMLFFLPYVTPLVAVAVVFRTIFNPDESAPANRGLQALGLGEQRWLFEQRPMLEVLFGWAPEGVLAGPSMALFSIMMFGVWSYLGFNVVILLAGLTAIPAQLYDAAKVDGAGGWHLFRHITLPMLSPVTYYLALIGFIGTMRSFEHIYVMRTPSAQGTVDVTSIVIFDTFFLSNQFGYASAQAVVLFILILGLTLAQNRLFGRRVFYD